MLQLFRYNRIQNYFFLLIYVLILRSHTFVYEYEAISQQDSILFNMIGIEEISVNFWLKLVSLILILYQVIYINRIVTVNNLIAGGDMFAGISYVLLISMNPDIHPLNSILIGNTFIIIAVFQMMQIIHRNQRSKRIFNTGFLIGLAILCNFNFIYLLVFFLIGTNALVVLRRRDITLYILGVSTVVYFLVAYWYLTDQIQSGGNLILSYFQWLNFPLVSQNYGIIKVGIAGTLILLIVAVFQQIISRQNIFVKNKLQFLFYYLLFSFLVFALGFHIELANLLLIFIPLSFLLGLYLQTIQKNSVAESFHFLLFIIAMMFQYFL